MDLDFTPEEQAFRQDVREFIRRELPEPVRAKCGALRRTAGTGTRVLPLSIASGAGVPDVIEAAFAALSAAREGKDEEPEVEIGSLPYTR